MASTLYKVYESSQAYTQAQGTWLTRVAQNAACQTHHLRASILRLGSLAFKSFCWAFWTPLKPLLGPRRALSVASVATLSPGHGFS